MPDEPPLKYTPFYCEENVWHLCQHPVLAPGDRQVIVITNAARQCPLFYQRAAAIGAWVLWDYHVIVVVSGAVPRQHPLVFDLDTRLGAPVPFADYAAATFDHRRAPHDPLAPRFRVIAATDYVARFGSDRSHMRDAHGRYFQPPPPWPPIRPEAGSLVLTDLLAIDASTFGPLLSLPELRARFGCRSPVVTPPASGQDG